MKKLWMQAGGMSLYRPEDHVVGQVCQVDRKICVPILKILDDQLPMNASLIVVAKKPQRGATKTRLCPPFMRDTLALAVKLRGVDLTLAYTPASAIDYFHNLVPHGFRLIPQSGADLGERLANALEHHLQQGYRKAVIMNSDGPTLRRADPAAGTSEKGFCRVGSCRCDPGHGPRRRLLPDRPETILSGAVSEHRVEHGKGYSPDLGNLSAPEIESPSVAGVVRCGCGSGP
jgi:hypothetical protein